MEVVVDGDAECVEVPGAVGGRHVPRQLAQGLRHTDRVVLGETPLPAADCPHHRDEHEDGQDDPLYHHQLPGGVP